MNSLTPTSTPTHRRAGLRLLHTSDWHLGRMLYGRRRDQEFEQLMSWMVQTVRDRQIEVVIVAGDVFDTATPGVRAQALYYQFLQQMVASSCRHVVIVGGNHDSALFLQAPGDLLRTLGVHVVGHAQENLSDQVLVLRDAQNQPELIVCAVPYLRDRDVRSSVLGESMQDKEQTLVQGIRQHYSDLADLAQETRQSLGETVPVVATGHLYAAGSQLREGDGVRDLYIGTLGQVHASVFGEVFDYVALGHLHIPQRVGQHHHIRYSGAPLAMGFGEANQTKSVYEVIFEPADPSAETAFVLDVQAIKVPEFQKLRQVRGDQRSILEQLEALQSESQSCWVEVLHDSDEVVGDLRQSIEQALTGSLVDVLRVRVHNRNEQVLTQEHPEELLQDLDPQEVFERCLLENQVPEEQQPELRRAYQQALVLLHEAADPSRSEP